MIKVCSFLNKGRFNSWQDGVFTQERGMNAMLIFPKTKMIICILVINTVQSLCYEIKVKEPISFFSSGFCLSASERSFWCGRLAGAYIQQAE